MTFLTPWVVLESGIGYYDLLCRDVQEPQFEGDLGVSTGTVEWEPLGGGLVHRYRRERSVSRAQGNANLQLCAPFAVIFIAIAFLLYALAVLGYYMM